MTRQRKMASSRPTPLDVQRCLFSVPNGGAPCPGLISARPAPGCRWPRCCPCSASRHARAGGPRCAGRVRCSARGGPRVARSRPPWARACGTVAFAGPAAMRSTWGSPSPRRICTRRSWIAAAAGAVTCRGCCRQPGGRSGAGAREDKRCRIRAGALPTVPGSARPNAGTPGTSATKGTARNPTFGTAIPDVPVRQRSRPREPRLAPGAARRLDPGDRKQVTLPQGCPDAALATNEPAPRSARCHFERPAWGTQEFLGRRAKRPAVVGEPVTPTLISRLLRPGRGNRNEKRAAGSKGRGQGVPIGTTTRR
jgi:hypothetical protein